MRKYLAVSTCLALFSAIAVAVAAPVSANAATRAPVQPIPQYRAVNVKNEGEFSGDWKPCAHFINGTGGTATASCSETVTSSTTVQVNATYNAKDISSSIGFQISHTYTFSVSMGLSVAVAPHHQLDIDFGTYYEKVHLGMEWRYCLEGVCGPWHGPTYFTEQKAISPAIGAFNSKPYP